VIIDYCSFSFCLSHSNSFTLIAHWVSVRASGLGASRTGSFVVHQNIARAARTLFNLYKVGQFSTGSEKERIVCLYLLIAPQPTVIKYYLIKLQRILGCQSRGITQSIAVGYTQIGFFTLNIQYINIIVLLFLFLYLFFSYHFNHI